ncbi:ExbD/TolR family protein [Maribacter hydrothermalis]|uniref:Biopolymer transporter ExbD n=1 Tax=Maribacter hydrothermalis TaxID=1836467 RepID=A0A1B7ZFA2_9FLAO|nr:biopolymer transporter ExbD [Maribacter hydrothermalis]APQ17753.1 biopolymer transporter ExbD [Maribacter hydrothermalis]OBR42228.1 biopolymer transporter ExbD [Maribacter hydrothermalis]
MIKFNKYRSSKTLPPVSTASLPDIVFILLFFFMTVTVMKNQNLLVENTLPIATETEKLDKKDRVIEIYIGKPTTGGNSNLGEEPRIQMENKFITVDEVGDYALQALSSMPQHLRSVATVSIKADIGVKMGIIEDLKSQLRMVNLLKINYTTYEGAVVDNI